MDLHFQLRQCFFLRVFPSFISKETGGASKRKLLKQSQAGNDSLVWEHAYIYTRENNFKKNTFLIVGNTRVAIFAAD